MNQGLFLGPWKEGEQMKSTIRKMVSWFAVAATLFTLGATGVACDGENSSNRVVSLREIEVSSMLFQGSGEYVAVDPM